MSAPVNESATVVSIGRQCRRRGAALAHAAGHGCVAVLPEGAGDGEWLTEGVGVGDGELLGVGPGVRGVGTGTGHTQVGWTTGAGAAASGAGAPAACRAAGEALCVAGTRPDTCLPTGGVPAAGCRAGAASLSPGTALTIGVNTA